MIVNKCVCNLFNFKKTVKKSMCRPHKNEGGGGGDKRNEGLWKQAQGDTPEKFNIKRNHAAIKHFPCSLTIGETCLAGACSGVHGSPVLHQPGLHILCWIEQACFFSH